MCVVAMLTAGTLAAADSSGADAAMNQNKEAIAALLSRNANPNAAQLDETTALHWAAHWEDAVSVDLVIRAGAKIEVKDKDGWSPETLALGHKFINGGFNRHEDTAALLRQLASSPRPEWRTH